MAAIAALLGDDYPRAKALLGQLLAEAPRDLLALHAAHSLDDLTGDVEQLADRVAAVLPASRDGADPCRHAVLAMHAGGELADLIDASALLWRLRLAGGDVGPRARAATPSATCCT